MPEMDRNCRIGSTAGTGMMAGIALLVPAILMFPASGSGRPQTRAQMERVPQFDNDRATSWKSIIPPHTESTLHRHDRFRTIVAIVGGDLKTVTRDGKTTVTHYETGKAYWQEPMPPGVTHKDVNDTDRTIELIVIEIR